MITASFHLTADRIDALQVEGHSGMAEQGADILCAAVTSAVRLVECTVNDVLGVSAHISVRKEKTRISLKLPVGLGEENETVCQSLLTGLIVYLTQLQEEYPDHLIVMEV